MARLYDKTTSDYVICGRVNPYAHDLGRMNAMTRQVMFLIVVPSAQMCGDRTRTKCRRIGIGRSRSKLGIGQLGVFQLLL